MVLPECSYLTDAQADLVKAFLDRGGHVIATGNLGANLDEERRTALFAHPLLLRTNELRVDDLPGGPQVVAEGAPDMAVNIQKVDEGAAIHIIRYDYDAEADEVPVLDKLRLGVRFGSPYRMVKAFSPVGEPSARLTSDWDMKSMHVIELENVPLYTVLLLH